MNNSAGVLDPFDCHLIVKPSPTARGHRYMFFLSGSGKLEGNYFLLVLEFMEGIRWEHPLLLPSVLIRFLSSVGTPKQGNLDL